MNLRCPYLKAQVELTEERETHIREKHPELLHQYRDQIDQTLADPERCGEIPDSQTVYYFPTGFLT